MYWLLVFFYEGVTYDDALVDYLHPEQFKTYAECNDYLVKWRSQPDFTNLAESLIGDDLAALQFTYYFKTTTELASLNVDLPDVVMVAK